MPDRYAAGGIEALTPMSWDERELRERIARELEAVFSFESHRPGGPKERWFRYTAGIIRYGLAGDPGAQRKYAEMFPGEADTGVYAEAQP